MKNPITKMLNRRRLAKTLKPDPEYRKRRLAHLTPERRERYLRNIADIGLAK